MKSLKTSFPFDFIKHSLYLLREGVYETNHAAGADPGLEAAPAQVCGRFDHWLVSELGKWAI
jgi:hypothetical protein